MRKISVIEGIGRIMAKRSSVVRVSRPELAPAARPDRAAKHLRSVIGRVRHHAVTIMNASGTMIAELGTLGLGSKILNPAAITATRATPAWISKKPPLDMLTPRQRETLVLLAEGKSTKEAAAALGISPKTAEFHRAQGMEKLGLHSRHDLVLFALHAGLVTFQTEIPIRKRPVATR